MKTPRKLTSLLLALLLVFALAATAAADGTVTNTNKGSITVDNPIKNHTYTAYKIFDVVYDMAKERYSYTIEHTSPWFDTVKSYTAGLKLTQVNDTNTYIVEKLGDFSAPTFADILKKALPKLTTNANGIPLVESSGKRTATVNELGYYFVTSTNGALCNLTTTDPAVTIYDKNDMPFVKTAPEKNVEVGQIVNYTIKGKVPDTTGFDEYTYEITDTMSEGLTFNRDSLTVNVGTENVTGADDKCTITYDEATPNTFKVTIKVMKCKVGDDIVVTYNATVNEKAVSTVSTNRAVLKYSNDPTNKDSKAEKPEVVHKVYSAKITIDKYWMEGETEHKLAGVGFKLYKNGTAENGGTDKKLYYVKNPDTDAVTWTEHVDQATQVMTSDTGEANFTGLANGTYYLEETKTPAGYNPLTDVKTIKINGSEDGTGLTETVRVENKTGAVLPSTGGMGTTVFYVLGAVLVVGAGVLLVTKKRMSRNEG